MSRTLYPLGERTTGSDELLAALLKLTVKDLRTAATESRQFRTAAYFLDKCGFLEKVLNVHDVTYARAMAARRVIRKSGADEVQA